MPIEKATAPKNLGGRPRKLAADEATLKALKGLGNIQCTTKEGAAFFSVSEPTFIKFLDDFPEAREALESGKGLGCISLRRHQWRMAEKNQTMAIWLGKQWLGQRDRVDHELAGPGGAPLHPPAVKVVFVDEPAAREADHGA